MSTFPEIATLPEVDRMAPPLSVKPPFTVSGFVPLVRLPEETVREVTVTWDDWLRVPVTVIAARLLPEERATDFPVPLNVTLDEDEAKLADETEEVFHDPAMDRVAPPNERTGDGPEAVRSEPKLTDAEARVSVPVNVRAETTVVVTPGLTVRLYSVCGTFTVPPEAFTRIVEVPDEKLPAAVAMVWTLITEDPADRSPFAATVSVVAVRERFEEASVVTAAPPWTVMLPADSPRVDIANVTATAPALKTTALNSLPGRFAPAKVIVCADEALNVTVPVPGFQDAEVLAFVHDPETVQVSEPRAM